MTTAPKPQPKLQPTLHDLAAALGISKRTLARYQKMDGAPERLKKGYPVDEWRDFIAAKRPRGKSLSGGVRKLAPVEPTPAQLSGEENRDRLLRLKCQELELKLELQRGELVPWSEVEAAQGQMLAALNSALDAMPKRTAPKITGVSDYHECVQILEEAKEHVKRMMRAWRPT